VFAKFTSQSERDTAVNLLRKAHLTEGDQKVWANIDMPFQERMLRTFVFGAKRVMIDEWKFPKLGLWADPVTGILWNGDDIIVTAMIQDSRLQLQYGDGWETFVTDVHYPEWNALITEINTKLKNVPTKGIGKKGKSTKAPS